MGIFGNKYKKCHIEGNDMDCIKYKPTKNGSKIPTATYKAILSQDCKATAVDFDGDPKDIEELEHEANEFAKSHCKKTENI